MISQTIEQFNPPEQSREKRRSKDPNFVCVQKIAEREREKIGKGYKQSFTDEVLEFARLYLVF